MPGEDHWLLDLDTSEDVHVTSTSEGVYTFYTERERAFIRTDHVVDVRAHR